MQTTWTAKAVNESDTHNIQIDVDARYVQEQSEPDNDRFVFAYTITISNLGTTPCQLLNRHWVITNAAGEVEEVRGAGVVGQQPTIEPGSAFRYTSGAILKTPVGAMQGEYEFCDASNASFEVPIPVFSLSVPNVVH